MNIEHHNRLNGFPEFREEVNALKTKDRRFRSLFDEYQELTANTEQMEAEDGSAPILENTAAKRRKALLEYELYEMLTSKKQTALI